MVDVGANPTLVEILHHRERSEAIYLPIWGNQAETQKKNFSPAKLDFYVEIQIPHHSTINL